MPFASCRTDEALAALADGATMLIAHPLQQRFWQQRFMTQEGSSICVSPQIQTWPSWLQRQAEQYDGLPIPLHHLQEQWLWEETIAADMPHVSDQGVRGLAVQAQQAYALIRMHDIDPAELHTGDDEAEALARWIRVMQGHVRRLEGRVLAADMPELLMTHMAGQMQSGRLLFSGFAGFSPLQQRFLTMLQQAGTDIVSVEGVAVSPARMQLRICADERDEWYQMADAIDEILQQDSGASIAIALPEQVDMTALTRVLDEVLLPEQHWHPQPTEHAAMMPGDALYDEPLIQQMLDVLSLAGQHRFRLAQCTVLLFSPWLKGYAEEREARAELDRRLRGCNRHQLGYDDLLYMSRTEELGQWHALLRHLAAWPEGCKMASEWVQDTQHLLQVAGAMQYAAESEQDTRLINAFREVLLSLAAVDGVGEPMPWSRFISMLVAGCVRARVSRPAHYAQLSIIPLGALAGLRFDHVFVPGLDEERFPGPARPHPLLPASVQKTYALPQSSAALAYEQACWQWRQLQQAGQDIVISYARQRDEKELLPATFAGELPLAPQREVAAAITTWPMQIFPDTPMVPLQPDESVRGGTALLKNQSACPFRAFVVHRLGIDRLESTMPGLTSGDKGSLLHQALEYIWSVVPSQQELAGLDAHQRGQLIADAIGAAWQGFSPVPAVVRQCEIRRMRDILTEWLELELERPAFSVRATEQSYQMCLPENAVRQFHLHIKADRLDEDETGHRILIDYKTGASQSWTRWLGERMEEPQLPLYALAAGLGAHDAVAFARVRRGDMGFEGLSGEDTGIRGITVCNGRHGLPEDWHLLMQGWHEQIHSLADEFARGRADVAPRNAQVCRYCGLQSLCRIAESGMGGGEEEP